VSQARLKSNHAVACQAFICSADLASYDFTGLEVLNIQDHGDARERDAWTTVAADLCNYELFWRTLIVLLTNRIEPSTQIMAAPGWIRLRSTIPCKYEQLAMHNYSVFYFAATARQAIDEDCQRLASGGYPHPERVFVALQASVERARDLQNLARRILLDLGIKWKFPKHPESLYTTIRLYRNALAHDPVLGRAIGHGRELLPPEARRPTERQTFLLWRHTALIPTSEMIDGCKLEHRLSSDLSIFLQKQWESLSDAFVQARQCNKFLTDLGLTTLLPIRCTLVRCRPP
jgi:hypothetical protein